MKQQIKVSLTVLIISILYGTEVDLFIPSFPDIQKTFELSPFLVQLTLSVNYIAYGICALLAGSLGDRFNRRQVIVYSLGIFVLGSACCVFSVHYPLLVFGRFLQGMGIAGPAVLGFVVITDVYPQEEHIPVMGVLNGMTTIAMAFAPVVGSYINLFFNWRANFIVLLGLGIFSFITSYLYIPNHKGNTSLPVSKTSYWPLLRSVKLMTIILCLSLSGVAYWSFIGMAPILYMNSLGVKLKHFGYYQGAICLSFGAVCLLMPQITHRYGLKNSFYYSLAGCLLVSIFIFFITIIDTKSPLTITTAMVLFGAFIAIPVQILFPKSLYVVPNSKARASALVNSTRLALTAIVLEVVSYYYTGNFFLLGMTITVLMMISLLIFVYITYKHWIKI